MDLPGMLQATHDLISDLATVEPDLPNAADAERDAALLAELDELKMEVDSIDGHMASLRSKLDELWGQAPSDEVYQLQRYCASHFALQSSRGDSVFMHRGEANFGHCECATTSHVCQLADTAQTLSSSAYRMGRLTSGSASTTSRCVGRLVYRRQR
jgi:hypothetical protein